LKDNNYDDEGADRCQPRNLEGGLDEGFFYEKCGEE